jgi:hypothetical protein
MLTDELSLLSVAEPILSGTTDTTFQQVLIEPTLAEPRRP